MALRQRKAKRSQYFPLYNSVPEASLKDEKLHELLALIDALRVGRARERAIVELKKRLNLGE